MVFEQIFTAEKIGTVLSGQPSHITITVVSWVKTSPFTSVIKCPYLFILTYFFLMCEIMVVKELYQLHGSGPLLLSWQSHSCSTIPLPSSKSKDSLPCWQESATELCYRQFNPVSIFACVICFSNILLFKPRFKTWRIFLHILRLISFRSMNASCSQRVLHALPISFSLFSS
jgi:hypothetical protein